jgi:hypothetical protein
LGIVVVVVVVGLVVVVVGIVVVVEVVVVVVVVVVGGDVAIAGLATRKSPATKPQITVTSSGIRRFLERSGGLTSSIYLVRWAASWRGRRLTPRK